MYERVCFGVDNLKILYSKVVTKEDCPCKCRIVSVAGDPPSRGQRLKLMGANHTYHQKLMIFPIVYMVYLLLYNIPWYIDSLSRSFWTMSPA